jgi:hypothetical protein
MHYVLHEIESGDLVKISNKPFTSAEINIGQAVEFKNIPIPDQTKYYWHPEFLSWRKK